jgi:hypothetical protein
MASPGMLCPRLGISYQHAEEVVGEFHAEGVLGPPRDGGRPSTAESGSETASAFCRATRPLIRDVHQVWLQAQSGSDEAAFYKPGLRVMGLFGRN